MLDELRQRAEALAEPARQVAIDAVTKSGFPRDHGKPFAALTAQQRREVFVALLPEWVDVLELAIARCGHVPLLQDGSNQAMAMAWSRLPRHPDLAAVGFFGALAALVQRAPADPVATADYVATWYDQTKPAPTVPLCLGTFVGVACDLPGEPGDRVFEALRAATRREKPASFLPLSGACIAALVVAERPEAWDFLLELNKANAFSGPLSIDAFCFAGQLATTKRILASLGERFDAWADSPRKSQIKIGPALADAAAQLALLDDAEARRRCCETGTPEEVMAALKMEMAIDLSEAATRVEELRRSADPARRNQGVWMTSTISAQGFPATFGVEMFDDPDECVRLCCVRQNNHARIGPTAEDRAAHFRRLERLLTTIEGDVPHKVPGDSRMTYPVGRDYVLLNMMAFAEPLDAMAPYVEQMADKNTRESLATNVGKRSADRPLTPLEIAMLGRLGADRSRDVKSKATDLMAKLDIDPAKAKAEWKKLGLVAPKAEKKPVLGKWAKRLTRRAAALEATCSFGKPASEEALAALEGALGLVLPPQLRELLLEANGMRDDSDTAREVSGTDGILDITRTVRQACGDYDAPPDVEGAVFFSDEGNGDYIGICGKKLGRLGPGTVVVFDHESGTLEKESKDLLSWIGGK